MPKGKVVTQIPKKRSMRRANDNYDWDKHAKDARKAWPNALLAEQSVPVSHINSVRGYRSEPFLNDDGYISVTYRDSVLGDDGIRRADAYLQWVPNETKEE